MSLAAASWRSGAGAALLVLTALTAGCTAPPKIHVKSTGGDQVRGKVVIRQYGCDTCHAMPGIQGARGRVGPPLVALDRRGILAGVLRNSADTLVQWIQEPRRMSPGTLMPNMNVTEDDARDIAAYLYSVDRVQMAPDPAPYLPPPEHHARRGHGDPQHQRHQHLRRHGVGAIPASPRTREPVGGAPAIVERAVGDPDRGRRLLGAHACPACHVIPGVRGADSHLGPTLDGMGSRRYVAGRLPNVPENMVRGLLKPPLVKPSTMMPDLRLSEPDARDMAAYLYTLR